MLFTTDKQTLDDLNIFGKHSGGSIYTLFNQTCTLGGAAVLEEMFRHPLADTEAINTRSKNIQFFAGVAAFPFDAGLFDLVEQYLDHRDQRTILDHGGDSLVKKLGSLIAEDTNYKFVYNGVRAVFVIVNGLKEFLAMMHRKVNNPHDAEAAAIVELLAGPVLSSLPLGTSKSKLSYSQVGDFDVVLRFRNRELIKKLLHYIYQLDVYIAIGKTAIEQNFVFPVALPATAHQLAAEGLYHPMMKSAVPNSVKLIPEGNVIFLTGANMAGKSTFMKSLGSALYLAHMGFPVAAKSMEFSVLDGIYTTINLPDNLGMGASHFYAEVLRIKKIAKELSIGKNLFVIIDELFRGTNVKDAYEATVAITSAFAKKRSSMFVISTHIIEAGDKLKEQCSNILFFYLPTLLEHNKPVYTYRLKEGISADRHGMIIINNEGILDILKSKKTKKA